MKKIVKKSIEARRRRLEKLQSMILEQEKIVEERNRDVSLFFCGLDDSKGRKKRDHAILLRDVAIGKLDLTKVKISKQLHKLEEVQAKGDCEPSGEQPEVSDEVDQGVGLTGLVGLAEKARRWGDAVGIKDFVVTLETQSGPVEVVELYRAKEVEVRPEGGIWPALFSLGAEEGGIGPEERRAWIEKLLSSTDPMMKRLIGILSTKGMLHMVTTEALTLRGRILPVNEDPIALAEGREALKDLLVVDAEVYK